MPHNAVLRAARRPRPVAAHRAMRGTDVEPIPALAVHRMRELPAAGHAVRVTVPNRAAWYRIRGALLAALGLGRTVVL